MIKNSSLIPFALLLLITVLGCGRLTERFTNVNSTSASGTDQPSSSGFTLAGKDWKSHDLEQMDINVELPGDPADKTPPDSMMPAGSKEIFSAIKVWSYDEKDFASSYTQLSPTGKRKFEIKELADTSMGALKKQARDLEYTLDITSPTKARYNGTFSRNGKNYELKGCCIFQKTNPMRVWAVITVFPTDSADGRTASERIIRSAAFDGSVEECE